MPDNIQSKVAYFSMEVGLSSKIPTYSGGLGVLAGDMFKAAADMSFPMVGITLLNKRGYFFQKIQDEEQTEVPVKWSVDDFLIEIDEYVEVVIQGRSVKIGCFVSYVKGIEGYELPVYFLHTDLSENTSEDRTITDQLYGRDSEYRLKQEIVLGVGGIRMLNKLGYRNLPVYHMNEGHSSLLVIELLRQLEDKDEVLKRCVFTTHTPVEAGHDKFDLSLVKKLLDSTLYSLVEENTKSAEELNMTTLALDFSKYTNAVAKKHAEVSKTMFENYSIHAITNGVHAPSWVSPHFEKLYDKYIPGWKLDPASLRSLTEIPQEELWEAHHSGKKQIIDFTNAHTNIGFDYDFITIGWARRFAPYKRPDLLFENTKRLEEIAEKYGPIQIIYAGKSHPNNTEGKALIKKIISISKSLEGKVRMAYLTNYDMYLSKFITSGVDVWLNTPLPPLEASGTSGMKCALNGIPQLSVLDGWWHEGCVVGKTGYSFETADELYNILEEKIVSRFYNERQRWIELMRNTIMLNGSFFNAHRMLSEYINLAYGFQEF